MTDQFAPSGGPTRPAERPPELFGLPAAMALIVGSVIGVGIFNLPTSLAFYGPITLISMALTTVGALLLALLFASLSRRLPADGGPYAYSRAAFGNRLGFANAWSYWITAWGGNAAIAVGWVLYVEHFINKGHNKLFSVLLVLIGLWIPAAINLSGVKNMGSVQAVTADGPIGSGFTPDRCAHPRPRRRRGRTGLACGGCWPGAGGPCARSARAAGRCRGCSIPARRASARRARAASAPSRRHLIRQRSVRLPAPW